MTTFTEGNTPLISQAELLERIRNNYLSLILDVRSEGEYLSGHIPKAVNISHHDLKNRLKAIDQYKDKEVIVYYRSGRRAKKAERVLHESGFRKVMHLKGDMIEWKKNNHPIE